MAGASTATVPAKGATSSAADGSGKRSRKRSRGKHRKSSATQDADADEEEKEGIKEDGASSEATGIHSDAKEVDDSAGPKLSFYERVNPHRPSAKAIPSSSGGRLYTVSVALPGSIILNAQTPELQARLAGQVARTCAIFNVDEIVIFDDGNSGQDEYHSKGKERAYDQATSGEQGEEGRQRERFDPNTFLARILQYLETPQYLRKALFPMHRDLRLAGLLPPLDCPHHLRFQDRAPYREGVVVDEASAAAEYGLNDHPNKRRKNFSNGSHHRSEVRVWVNVGLKGPIEATASHNSEGGSAVPQVGTRVTVQVDSHTGTPTLVSPRQPTEQAGLYWGYTVRLASSLGLALSDAPWPDGQGYDLLIGTSERGRPLETREHGPNGGVQEGVLPLKAFQHAIVVLGGLSGLEDAVQRDAGLEAGADEADALFDVWVNLVEGQGSRTIRTEEALMIALARLKGPLESSGGASNT
ncbi:hypothetical protein OC846_000701 [Tilletia horrida]|uniref:DUF171-domain-containing protein n=1 Tax=Tilletia horrida TaxID=155126 RepID=A0AAN6GXL0_9BASI|nr:hypothetical protein OC846_000701 [Tilletia horrida]